MGVPEGQIKVLSSRTNVGLKVQASLSFRLQRRAWRSDADEKIGSGPQKLGVLTNIPKPEQTSG